MKKLYIALSILVLNIAVFAQNKNTQAADKLFNQYEYVAATAQYLKLVDSGNADGYVYKQLADTYYNVFNTVEAEKWYTEAVKTKQDAETYFKFSQMLKANKKYDAANEQLKKFAELSPNDQRAKNFNEKPNLVTKILEQRANYTAKALDINSEASEFGPVLYGNSLYFTSSRGESGKKYGWNKELYLDIYKSTLGDSGLFSVPTPVSTLNSKYHDGPVTISNDGKTAYFSGDTFRDDLYEKDKKNKLSLSKNGLYVATKSGDDWSNIKPLPFNNKNYSVSNPSLSKDGKTLYFSSNMPGSLGGVDIWMVSVDSEKGIYGIPKNLGSKVNTEANESFPQITEDNLLYFASTGKQGLGGLDIYEINLNDNSEAVNLGMPVNSEKDDFSFSFNKAKNIAYFASNRNGNDDLFQANPICLYPILPFVTNINTGNAIANATVSFVDSNNKVLETQTTTDSGKATFKGECGKTYNVQVTRDGYDNATFPVTVSKDGKLVNVLAKLKPTEAIVTEKEIILSPIYFEYNKANITADAAFELDKLIVVMKEKPELVIMAKSHTDNRGADIFNLKLSEKRAKSTVQYIISKGIDVARISGKGMGETELKVACGEVCIEEDHAKNRRSEFLIVK